jgi:hypothetical protein
LIYLILSEPRLDSGIQSLVRDNAVV